MKANLGFFPQPLNKTIHPSMMENREMIKHNIEIEDRETGDAIMRAIIDKMKSFINADYTIIQEGEETYVLFRCVDMAKYIRRKRLFKPDQKTLEEKMSSLIKPPFMVADEENKTYFVFRPIPQN